ncbi:hypothetical protein [Lederbergia panacisoli]|uniref:hypothetical protein n=1 Tax=Lederbergia panacisoli TaxID=1255251 RepID=UPI00214B3EA2|nr:hypothetical protein [Lederbergia panacisoli]MCR2822069.1 hypothetical protein [Lederbergia panacisoli]
MEHTVHSERDIKHLHDKCKHHLYQFVQVELNDGSVYQGILHSHDREKLYLIMPKMHQHMEDESSSRLFPFFGPFGLYGFPFFGMRAFGPFFPFFI